MGRTWGRLYAGTRNHRKIRILRQRHPTMWFAWYVMIELAIECDDDGWIYVAPDRPYTWKELAQEIGTGRADTTERFVRTLIELGLASYTEGKGIRLPSYSERNYESDFSAVRTRKYRERKKLEGADVTSQERHSDVTVTPQSRDRTETEQNRTKVHTSVCVADPAAPSGDAVAPRQENSENLGSDKGGVGADPNAVAPTEPHPDNPGQDAQPEEKIAKPPPPPKFGPAAVASLWNELGCRPGVQKLTDARRRKLAARLRERADPEWWRELCLKIKELQIKGRDFLTFDFVIRDETNIMKVLEGVYDPDFKARQKTAIAAGNQPAGDKLGHYSRLVAGQAPSRSGPARDVAPA